MDKNRTDQSRGPETPFEAGLDEGGARLADFVRATRSLTQTPDDRTEARHLSMIASARGLAVDRPLVEPTLRRTLMDRIKPVIARAALAVSLLTGSTAGLAYAGVDLPGSAAEKAFEKVGIELPNQTPQTSDNNKSVSGAVHDVKGSTEERGCEFGHSVAAAARSNSQGKANPSPTPCINGGSETGAAKSAEGRANKDAKAQGGSETGAAKSAEGRANKDAKAQGGTETGAAKSAEGRANKDANAQGGSETGAAKGAEGRAGNDTKGQGAPSEEDE